MKAALVFLGFVLAVFVTLPIWFYLLYKLLQAVQATDLMWFLYWAYLPAALVTAAIGHLIKVVTDE